MDGLRWLLLLFGLFVVAGVYFYTRYQRDRVEADDANDSDLQRQEPSLGETEEPGIDLPAADSQESLAPPADTPAAAQKIVTLRVVARNNGALAGDELLLSLRGIGMRHGRFGIFHRFEGTDEDSVIFSAASLVEPGSFDIANIKDQEIPGISLFMVLPGPVDGAQGFDLMIAAARALTQSLNAELFDESGSSLSIQRERYLREEIIQFQHNSVVA